MKVEMDNHVCERDRDRMENIVVTPTIEDNDNDLKFRESWSEASVSIENYNENNGELDIKFSDFENDSSNESVLSEFIPLINPLEGMPRKFNSMIYLPKPDFKDSTKDITKANHEVNGYYYTQPPFMGSHSDKLIAIWSSKFGVSCSAVNDLRDNILRDPEFRIYDVTMDAKKRNQRFNETVRPCDRMIHMPIYKDLSVSNS